jgi:hypothetical protein
VSFYPQPNLWTCGPFALKHSLIALGKFVKEDELAAVAKTHWWSGTNELGLARAARLVNCDIEVVRTLDEDQARKTLNNTMRRKLPALLCVDDWGHWIAVLSEKAGRYVIVDSNLDPVLNVVTWKQLRDRWCYFDTDYDKDHPPTLFDLMPIIPRGVVRMRADLSVERVKYLRRPAHHALAASWNEVVDDLAAICRPRSTAMQRPLSIAEFLRRHGELLRRRVRYWHGDIADKDLARLLDHYRFVAEAYGLVIPAASARRALVDFTALLTLWVAARRGVDPFYE